MKELHVKEFMGAEKVLNHEDKIWIIDKKTGEIFKAEWIDGIIREEEYMNMILKDYSNGKISHDLQKDISASLHQIELMRRGDKDQYGVYIDNEDREDIINFEDLKSYYNGDRRYYYTTSNFINCI